MRPAGLIALVLSAGLVLLTACGHADGTDLARGLARDLGGHRFAAREAEGITLPDGTRLVITFETFDGLSGQLGVQGGCNLIGGEIAIADDGRLRSVDGWVQTEMACAQPLMDLDNAVVALLSAEPTLRLDGRSLTIAAGDVSMVLDRL